MFVKQLQQKVICHTTRNTNSKAFCDSLNLKTNQTKQKQNKKGHCWDMMETIGSLKQMNNLR